MTNIITLTCPTCGGKLQITPDIDRFACAHCGNEHIVKRSEGLVALQPLAASLSGLQRATDRAATELGLRRANEELGAIEARHAAAGNRLAEARLAIQQGRRRTLGLLLAGALGISTIVCCVAGAMIPMLAAYTSASAGETTISDTATTGICITTGLGLLLLILAIVFGVRASRLPKPTQSSQQAAQAASAAQTDLSAAAAELQAKQAEIEELRRGSSPPGS